MARLSFVIDRFVDDNGGVHERELTLVHNDMTGDVATRVTTDPDRATSEYDAYKNPIPGLEVKIEEHKAAILAHEARARENKGAPPLDDTPPISPLNDDEKARLRDLQEAKHPLSDAEREEMARLAAHGDPGSPGHPADPNLRSPPEHPANASLGAAGTPVSAGMVGSAGMTRDDARRK